MSDGRPDPDQLLSSLSQLERTDQRGRLKVFFGASPGVGKTYSMLQEARALRGSGLDVVAGYVEPHGRAETEGLLRGIEELPPRMARIRDIEVREFDLDAALARRPALLLVDELAHSNAPGLRHAKRWQDVEELLAAGIDVYTTLNVQHLESLNDVVAQITGVTVRETVPDSVLERADEIELVDVTPDELLTRLRAGKVYVPEQAERAMRSFFSKANLTALREMALRHTAQKVDVEMQAHRALIAPQTPWAASERLLVCIGPSPHSANLVRATARLARGLRADWEAVYVETPAAQQLTEAQKQRVLQTMQLAEQLGGRSTSLTGTTVADTLVDYARQRNATKILVGKPSHSAWRDRLRGSLVDAVIRRSGDIDVYVLRAAGEFEPGQQHSPAGPRPLRWQGYLTALLAVCGLTAAAWLWRALFSPPNMIMLYLLVVVLIARRYQRGPAVFASVLSVAAFDFFFIDPFLTFAVSDMQYLLTFGVMLVAGLVIAGLTSQLKQTASEALTREKRTAGLYSFSRALAATGSTAAVAELAEQQVGELFGLRCALILPRRGSSSLELVERQSALFERPGSELAVAQWCFDNGRPAGLAAQTLPGAEARYIPVATVQGRYGVLAVKAAGAPGHGRTELASLDLQHQLETVATLAALALERQAQADARVAAQSQVESEQLRNSLLSSISHDLRTPLAGISGAASTLLTLPAPELQASGRPLLETIRDGSERLALLVTNILDMTRLEAGKVELRPEWLPLEEAIGAALTALEPRSLTREIRVALPEELPLVQADPVLLERLLANLLDNALRYTPADSPIEISARSGSAGLSVSVADRGPGLGALPEELLSKFSRGSATATADSAPGERGAGLGLSICRAIVEAHGGHLYASNRSGGGAEFSFSLPQAQRAPELPPETESAGEATGRVGESD